MSTIGHEPDTGYNIRAGAEILADRFVSLPQCDCGEILTPAGKCLNVGDCRRADRQASTGSRARGRGVSILPVAFTIGGRVD